MHILLVEDDEINRLIIGGILEKHGHRVEVAENGVQAVAAVAAKAFDVILMDRQMPEMGGLEATRRIRAMAGRNATLPVVGVTAAGNDQEIAACLDAGMNDVVTKPIDPADLVQALAPFTPGVAPVAHARAVSDAPPSESVDVVFDETRLTGLRNDYGEETANQLIADFRRISVETAGRLRIAAENKDFDALERSAHDLKSNAHTMGLQRLSAHCRSIELACPEGRFEDALLEAARIDGLLAEGLGALEIKTGNLL